MPARVLIVDDDRELAESLADFVAMNGHDVSTASNGKEAVDRSRVEVFDIFVSDVRMPVMNGVDSFFEIRKLKPNAKFIMMTGLWEPLVERALQAGALCLLQKPFNLADLLVWIDRAAAPDLGDRMRRDGTSTSA